MRWPGNEAGARREGGTRGPARGPGRALRCGTFLLEPLTAARDLERLQPEWSRLWEQDPGATPFQTPEWLLPWWRHVGEGELRSLALRTAADGRLVGLLPLYRLRSLPGEPRRLLPLGAATSDYLPPLLAAGREREAARALLAGLAALPADWETLELTQQPPGSPLLAAPPPDGWGDEAGAAEPCLALDLPEREEDLRKTLPPGLQRNLPYYRRRAERAGRVRFLQAGGGGYGPELEPLFAAHVRLHRLRWEARGQAGVLERAEVVEANRLAARGLQARGLLRLLALELEGRIIATLCAFADRPRPGAWLYYLGAFDPAWRHLGPGSLLVEQAIRRAVREGARRFDFLRGRERYKLLWGARERPTCRRTLRRPDREGPR